MGSAKGFGRRPSCEAKVNPLSVECVARKTSSRKARASASLSKPNSSTMNLATIGPFLCFEKPLLTGYKVSSTSKMSVSTALPPVAMVRVAARLVARRRSVGRPRMQFRRRVDGV